VLLVYVNGIFGDPNPTPKFTGSVISQSERVFAAYMGPQDLRDLRKLSKSSLYEKRALLS
jgi:hypothetical protein